MVPGRNAQDRRGGFAIWLRYRVMLVFLLACVSLLLPEVSASVGRAHEIHCAHGVQRSNELAFPMCAELFRAALGAKSEHTFGEGGARTARGGWGIINRTGDLMGVAAGWDLGAAGPLLKRHGVPQATAPDFEIAIAPRPTSRDHARARRTG